MGRLLNLRISLADRAGALAQSATVIGLHGGNILSVDIHRSDGDLAVDDIKVLFADEPDLADLEADLLANAAANLVAHEDAVAEDRVAVALTTATDLVVGPAERTGESGSGDYERAVGAVVAAARFSIVAHDEVEGCQAGRDAIRSGQVVTSVTRDLPKSVADPDGSEFGLLVANLPDGRALVGVRPAASAWTITEAERIEAAMRLVSRLHDSSGTA